MNRIKLKMLERIHTHSCTHVSYKDSLNSFLNDPYSKFNKSVQNSNVTLIHDWKDDDDDESVREWLYLVITIFHLMCNLY